MVFGLHYQSVSTCGNGRHNCQSGFWNFDNLPVPPSLFSMLIVVWQFVLTVYMIVLNSQMQWICIVIFNFTCHRRPAMWLTEKWGHPHLLVQKQSPHQSPFKMMIFVGWGCIFLAIFQPILCFFPADFCQFCQLWNFFGQFRTFFWPFLGWFHGHIEGFTPKIF